MKESATKKKKDKKKRKRKRDDYRELNREGRGC